MGLKDLRDKFHDFDAKLSSSFHKEEDGVKKPSWVKIIPVWLGLIIMIAIVSSVAISLLTVNVHEELTPVSSSYSLNYSSYKSSTWYIYSKSGDGPNRDAYHISYNGRLKVELDLSNSPHSEYFEKIMESYLDGNNEYNASTDIQLIAYDSNNKEVQTTYMMIVDNDKTDDMTLQLINLLSFTKHKIEFKDGILSLRINGEDTRLSDSSFNDSLKNIEYINGTIHVYNKNALDPSDSGFYNYTFNFTIPKNSINIKNP